MSVPHHAWAISGPIDHPFPGDWQTPMAASWIPLGRTTELRELDRRSPAHCALPPKDIHQNPLHPDFWQLLAASP